MARIGKRVRDVARARLVAAWASTWAAIEGDYTLTPAEAGKVSGIDWTGARAQVFQGDVDIGDLDETTTLFEPAVTFFTDSAEHDGQEKFRLFSGSTTLVIRIFWEWAEGNAKPDFEEVPDAIQDLLVAVFHSQSWLGAIGAGVTYTGQASFGKGPVVRAGENWRREIVARMRFGVDV